jgi:hypothetical protein
VLAEAWLAVNGGWIRLGREGGVYRLALLVRYFGT